MPSQISLFECAFVHKSTLDDVTKRMSYLQHNERLEFLGDAILGALVAELLFELYPSYNEGVLTRLRSAIVCRKNLNSLAKKLGFVPYIICHEKYKIEDTHIPGDVLEAIVAAIYLDGGLSRAKKFVRKHVVDTEMVKTLVSVDGGNGNYKSKILEIGQKAHCEVLFDTHYLEGNDGLFISHLKVNGQVYAEGTGKQKKQAEQEASRRALERCDILSLDQFIVCDENVAAIQSSEDV